MNKTIAFFDCFSGISGDMTLGAFIDLGVPADWIEEHLKSLPLPGVEIIVDEKKQNAIAAKDITVAFSDEQMSRDYAFIKNLIKNSPLLDSVKNNSLKIFAQVARAEAKIHGRSIDKVHFHETGAVDSIADIVGTALCIEYLGIEKFACSRLPLGSGFVKCSHGTIPIPAPATAEILKGVPVFGSGLEAELVTPTGAAIVRALVDDSGFGSMPEMTISKIGFGAGKRELEDRPNLLRIILGKTLEPVEKVFMVETSIDDMNPEIYGHLMERLFEDGAKDVFWTPVYMKKNRPGTLVQVVCGADVRDAIIARILIETSSIGVRHYSIERTTLEREKLVLETSLGSIDAKKVFLPGGKVRIAPEFESCRRIAMEKQIPLRDVYDLFLRELP